VPELDWQKHSFDPKGKQGTARCEFVQQCMLRVRKASERPSVRTPMVKGAKRALLAQGTKQLHEFCKTISLVSAMPDMRPQWSQRGQKERLRLPRVCCLLRGAVWQAGVVAHSDFNGGSRCDLP